MFLTSLDSISFNTDLMLGVLFTANKSLVVFITIKFIVSEIPFFFEAEFVQAFPNGVRRLFSSPIPDSNKRMF